MMIGLSLSLCIRDIITSKVREQDVHLLVTGNAAVTGAHWNRLLERYMNIYWTKDPLTARQVALRFYDYGKLIQPRIDGRDGESPYLGDGHWLHVSGQPTLF